MLPATRLFSQRMRLEFLHPKFWITWVGLCLMRSLELLPFPAQRRAGSAIGMLLQHLPLHFKRIARRNIDLCLPELGEAERASLVDRHFRSLGMALCETANTWWSSDARVNKLADVQGLHHLQAALARAAAPFCSAGISPPLKFPRASWAPWCLSCRVSAVEKRAAVAHHVHQLLPARLSHSVR